MDRELVYDLLGSEVDPIDITEEATLGEIAKRTEDRQIELFLGDDIFDIDEAEYQRVEEECEREERL